MGWCWQLKVAAYYSTGFAKMRVRVWKRRSGELAVEVMRDRVRGFSICAWLYVWVGVGGGGIGWGVPCVCVLLTPLGLAGFHGTCGAAGAPAVSSRASACWLPVSLTP